MRFARVLVLALLVALIGAGAAAAAPQPVVSVGPPFTPKSDAAARAIAEERAVYALINRAERRVAARRQSCRFPRLDFKSSVTRDVPSQPVLDVIAALRRPATTEETSTRDLAGLGFGETYVDYVRAATAANGQRFTIIIARSVRPSYRLSASCLDAQREELLRLLQDSSQRRRSATLRAFATLRREQEQRAEEPTTPQDGIYLFTRNADGRGGGGGGGGNAAEFLRRGSFTSQGGSGSSRLNGLVPDGVASVTLEYPRVVSRGRFYEPTVYPSALTRTVKVQQNVLSLRVPRGAGDAFPSRMVWRAADGAVIRVIKERR